jgi:hypothetical protein
MNMRTLTCAFILTYSSTAQGINLPEPGERLTLQDAIQIALKNNLRLNDAHLSLEEIHAKFSQINTAMNSRLSIAGVRSQQTYASQNYLSAVSYNNTHADLQLYDGI